MVELKIIILVALMAVLLLGTSLVRVRPVHDT